MVLTAEWILKARKKDILEHKDEVFHYLSVKEKVLESLRKNNLKAFKESYLTYEIVLCKVWECGLKWKIKTFGEK